MKKNLLKNALLLVAVLFTTSIFAQDWVKMMHDPNVNFYDVQKAFNTYAAKKERQIERENRKLFKKKGEAFSEGELEVPGYEQYKRWEYFMKPRVSQTGERFAPDAVWNEMKKYKEQYGAFVAGNWTLVGPTTSTVPSGGGGAGRTNFVTIHPTTPTTLWTGSPGGGLWKSTDGGTTWSTNTDNLPQVIGCSDLAIDPTTPNTMYLATGDCDGGDTYSVGILKTIDGGTTWNTTGLSFSLGLFRMVYRIVIDPSATSTIYAATTSGVYKSTNAGTTWAVIKAGSFTDIKMKPGTTGSTATLYTVGTNAGGTGPQFSYSTNAGTTWTTVTAAFNATPANVQRMAIAVSANNPAVVYVISAKITTYDLDGFYKSTNSGAAFTKLTVSPASPSIIGTQGFYALSIAANPTNANEVFVGGLDTYKCTSVPSSGTATFTQMSYWAAGSPYVHADIHELEYNGSNIYACCDGGLFVTSNGGTAWTDKSNGGLQISEMYGFGQSQTNASKMISGWQDNGTNLYTGTWSRVIGGDGMKAFVSWNNDQNMWGSLYNGNLQRSTNGGTSFSTYTTGITDPLNTWVTEYNEDPVTAGTVYAGFANVWKSVGGAAWAKAGTINNLGPSTSYTVNVNAIAVSPANAQVIWAAKGSTLFKTSNGGTSWSVVSSAPNGSITDIACSQTDANKAWITFSGYMNTMKVYVTTNQGTSWTNMSASLPNIPVNCITVDKNGTDAIYIGTDAGVFYRDGSMSVWQPFFNGLPNVNITQLEIYYGSPAKLRTATYGRGIWETTLFQSGTYAPTANFGADKQIGCPGLGVQFSDWSAGQPTAWSWVFQGGNPATSTQQNPFVAYNSPGTYSVSLTATNANGTDSKTYTGFITVSASANAAPTSAGKNYCGSPAHTVSLTATPSATGTVRWWNQPAGGTVLGTGNNYTTPAISGTQTYYVDEAFPSAGVDFVGAPDNTMGAGAFFTANDIRGLYFDVMKPVVINSVQVYANTAGVRTIEIDDSNGNWLTDTTLNIAASGSVTPTTVTINRTVYPGTNYFMKFRGTVDCWRNNAGSTLPTTPYTDGGSNAVKITNTNAGSPGYYYYFYNWNFTVIQCNTGRTAVTVTDTCTAIGVNDLFANNYIDVYPNPNNGLFNVAFQTSQLDNYVVKVTNTIGQTVYEEKLTSFSGNYSNKIDISTFRKGIYLLSVSNSKNQTVKKVLIY
ncbi:MAG TPA: T9SS type A sorting domain-containing protein [Bacteroidia bacterium]